MSFDLATLQRLTAEHGAVARVVVVETRGSAPREPGAAMLVWRDGDALRQHGTIGGGALELEAARHAFDRQGPSRHALGPDLGQCCGGAMTLWTETFTEKTLPVPAPVFARGAGAAPLAVQSLLARASALTGPQLVSNWLIEPMTPRRAPLWIWGAGHVGRALVDTLTPLNQFAITWVDTAPDRFPDRIPAGVTVLPAPDIAKAMPRAPHDAAHLILTYSHALDLDLCHAALRHGFGFCGLIGSNTKKARFTKRLRALGHPDAQIARICCPIGQKHLGKHPHAIAIGVAAQLLTRDRQEEDAWTIPSSALTG